MPFFGTDTKSNILKGQYTWSYLYSSVKSRAVREHNSSMDSCDKYGTPNLMALKAKHDNPSIAPPFSEM